MKNKIELAEKALNEPNDTTNAQIVVSNGMNRRFVISVKNCQR